MKAQVDGESLIRRALEAVPSGLVTVVVSQYPDILALAGEYGFAAVANDLSLIHICLYARSSAGRSRRSKYHRMSSAMRRQACPSP